MVSYRITRNVYDVADQVVQIETGVGTPDAQVERTMAYTTNGQVDWIEDANGNRTDFTYDGHDRLIVMNFPVPTKGAHAASSSDYEHYTLDANGNRTGLRLRDGQPGSWIGPRFGYTGQMRLTNALPLWHYKARVYYPNIGRFLQTDPIGCEDSLNLYQYVGNDPVNGVDPTGMYGKGTGWEGRDAAWRRFDTAQQDTASDMEGRAARMEQQAARLDAAKVEGGDQLRSDASNLRAGAAALRSDGSDGRFANVVDQDRYQELGGTSNGAAFVRENGPIMTINADHDAWGRNSDQAGVRWILGHESLHTAGLDDQRGPNGALAYRDGFQPQRRAFAQIRGTHLEHINPDSLMDMAY